MFYYICFANVVLFFIFAMETIIIQDMGTNRDLVQSYKFTTIRNDLGLYGQRTLINLIAASQQILEGKKIGDCVKYQVEENLWGYKRVIMPITAIMAEGDKTNHSVARKQLKMLQTKLFEYNDDGIWISSVFFSEVKFDLKTGNAILEIPPTTWRAIMDFSAGYRLFEKEKALQLRSTYSMRLYQLLSGQKSPLTYKLVELKKMFGLEDKYERPANFINRVIIPAKEELDKYAPYTFEYMPVHEHKGVKGRSAITAITFYPVYQPKNRDKSLEEKREFKNIEYKYPNIIEIPSNTKNYMIHTLGFTLQGIKNNSALILEACKVLDLDNFLRGIAPRARTAKKPQGYIIRALKLELKEHGIQ